MSQAELEQQETYYDRVGGHETFVKLVHEFYKGVATDEPLRELYPEEDLGPAEERLRLFLEQYWGGPKTYSETRGHPRLRMRHVDYKVTPTQRDRWLKHMNAAIDTLELAPLDDELMRGYMAHAANFMINAEDD
ncbi:globin [Ornithinimicrobium faecis]|uniref:Globin n=1 Tax=Ornithinimicrobium faecis TaxID=2934158 RepID=A0ABY4YRJ0_9MICO|nr:globin [Ornithinimicrobium sp. HY1793]USQ78993.1 globin [Ornithinimicrobium sp. HY1793]